jgi:hypothetical protein
MTKLLTEFEAADLLQLTPRQVLRLANRGELPRVVFPNGEVRFDEADLSRFIESHTAWYLFGDPADIAAFGIAYLDGNEQPTVEAAPQCPDVLGEGWRGYFDFGVCQLDPRGGVKSEGE